MSPNFKFQLNQRVFVNYENYRLGEAVESVVIATKVYQSRYYRRDAFSIEYCCSPLELEGLEHDQEEWVPECHTGCLPRILNVS
jgi:hypothetical protein